MGFAQVASTEGSIGGQGKAALTESHRRTLAALSGLTGVRQPLLCGVAILCLWLPGGLSEFSAQGWVTVEEHNAVRNAALLLKTADALGSPK